MSQLSEEQETEGIPDDLPYRIVEAMGLGLTFRSCSCGQLPCARLRPLRDALETVRRDTATAMRDKCVEKVKEIQQRYRNEAAALISDDQQLAHFILLHRSSAAEEVITTLESLTLDQVKPGEM